jgi:hypothetical protein
MLLDLLIGMTVLGRLWGLLSLLHCCSLLFLLDFKFLELTEDIDWLARGFNCASVVTNIDANLIIVAEYLTNDLVPSD